MANVPREPKIPPITTPLLEADGRTMTPAWHRYFQGERGFSDNVNSGTTRAETAAAAARVDAAAAQATADAANQGVADVQAGVASGTITFSASVSPFSVGGTRIGTGPVTTDAATVTVAGGTGPFTYAWAYVSGFASLTTNSPTSATTTFSGTISLLGQDRSAVYRCTITDTFDASTVSVTLGVSISELS